MNSYRPLRGVLLVVLLLAACRKEPPREDEPLPDAGPAAPNAYISKPGRFSVVFPGSPTESSRVEDHAAGTFTLYQVRLESDGLIYNVNYWDLSPGTTFDFDAGRDSAAPADSARVVKETPIKRGRHEGREWEIEVTGQAKGSTLFRVYLVERRVYEVYVWEQGGKAPTERAIRFLDSFRLHK